MLRLSIIAMAAIALAAPAAFAENATSAVRQGNSLYLEGKYEEALKKYQAAQVEAPEDKRIMFNLGNAQYRLDHHEEALSEFTRSLQTDDDNTRAESHYNAGNALYRGGRLEEAVDQYLKTLEINPDDEDAKYNLEFVRKEIERRKEQQQERQKREQEQQKDSQKEKKEGEQGSPDEKNHESGEQPDQGQQHEQQKEPEKQPDSQPGTQPEPGQDNQPAAADRPQQKQNMTQQQITDEENIQRWLDVVEAETSENMKDFLRKQQPAATSTHGNDW